MAEGIAPAAPGYVELEPLLEPPLDGAVDGVVEVDGVDEDELSLELLDDELPLDDPDELPPPGLVDE